MTLPYQCLTAYSRSEGGNHEWAVFGASGSSLVVHLSNGSTTQWPREQQDLNINQDSEDQEPPGKRIKLSPTGEQSSNFSSLKLSSDKKHLVAVTGEDKSIRVFQINEDGRLHQLSQRCMTRRPCSVTLTADDSTILCADKFGDVYALPLIPSQEDEQNGSAEPATKQQKLAPSANLLTVHSGRNRKTLEEQFKQIEKGQAQAKETPKFKHDLLLGHVSMLTDVVYTTVGPRTYILTADRDEHIRVSRGPPQAHIIESFCQGHEEFVSRLCLLESGHLVSGGGDAQLYVWDWLSSRLLEKIPIRDAVLLHYSTDEQLSPLLPADNDSFKTAVSGIWSVPYDKAKRDEILVACEGVPALFSLAPGSSSKFGHVLPLRGNALSVAFIELQQGTCTAIVSIDHVHKAGSTTEIRSDEVTPRLQYFSYRGNGLWEEDTGLAEALKGFHHQGTRSNDKASEGSSRAAVDGKAIGDMLYGVENLRKRPGAED